MGDAGKASKREKAAMPVNGPRALSQGNLLLQQGHAVCFVVDWATTHLPNNTPTWLPTFRFNRCIEFYEARIHGNKSMDAVGIDATPTYMPMKSVPARIAEAYPGYKRKIVIMLRDPIVRTYSHCKLVSCVPKYTNKQESKHNTAIPNKIPTYLGRYALDIATTQSMEEAPWAYTLIGNITFEERIIQKMDKFDACMKGGFALNKSHTISEIWDHCYISGEGLMYSIYGTFI